MSPASGVGSGVGVAGPEPAGVSLGSVVAVGSTVASAVDVASGVGSAVGDGVADPSATGPSPPPKKR
jgi:hypothetical protein